MSNMKKDKQNNTVKKFLSFFKISSDEKTFLSDFAFQRFTTLDSFMRIYFIIVCGFVASLSIQQTFGIEQMSGGFLVSCLLMFIFYRDLIRYKPSYIKQYNMILLLGILLIATLLIGRLFGYLFLSLSKGFEYEALDSAIYGIPIPIGAMLVSLLFDFHTAITFSFIVSLLTGIWLQDASYTIYAFVGSITAAFSVISCKKRSALLKGGGYVIAANILTVIIILFFNGEIFTTKAPPSIMYAAIGGLSVIAIVTLLLPLIEYLFKVTTDISLLELLDLD